MRLINIKKKINRVKNRTRLSGLSAFSNELFYALYTWNFFRKLVWVFSRKTIPKGHIFIFGTYNSGSTMLKQAIGLHSDVLFPQRESYELSCSYSDLEMGTLSRGCGGLLNYQRLRGTIKFDGKMYCRDMNLWFSPETYFLDKAVPLLFHSEQVLSEFPSAKVILIDRNRESIIEGVLKRGKARGEAKTIFGGERFSDDFCRTQCDQFDEMLLKIRRRPGLDVHSVFYDDFITDPAVVISGVYKFLGLEAVTVGFEKNLLTVGGSSMEISAGYWSNNE